MNLKGSQTEKNLWLAFAGESQARNKYTFFAELAAEEGLADIAAIFEKSAAQEKEHALAIFKFLCQIKNTESNLKSSAQAENYEWTTMYEEFARVASEEGFEEISNFFRDVIQIEKEHEEKYLSALKKLKQFENNGICSL